ncbi:helix-turn-helix domain-containing protein, partial [Aurantimonas sp. C2-5-R2]
RRLDQSAQQQAPTPSLIYRSGCLTFVDTLRNPASAAGNFTEQCHSVPGRIKMTDAEAQAILDKAMLLHSRSTSIGVRDLCTILGVSERTIRRRQQEGQMPARTKLGRKLVYEKADISAWLAEQVRG